MFRDLWTSSSPKFPPSSAPATAIAFRSFSPAARWYDSSSHRMYGMLSAIGAYRKWCCISSWYFPTRSIRARNVDVSRRDLNSMLNASRTCSPGFIANSSSRISVAQWRPHRGSSQPVSRVRTPAIW